jgi:hypothetical protein
MAVAVPDRAERSEGAADARARLLFELPSRRDLGVLPRLDLPARELPEPTEQPMGGPTLHPPSSGPVGEDDHRRAYVRAPAPPVFRRKDAGVRQLGPGAAVRRDGTDFATRADRHADRFPELHDGLGERPGRPVSEGGGERALQPGPDLGAPDVPSLERPSRRDPEPVRIERDRRDVEGDRSDRPGDVGPDPR